MGFRFSFRHVCSSIRDPSFVDCSHPVSQISKSNTSASPFIRCWRHLIRIKYHHSTGLHLHRRYPSVFFDVPRPSAIVDHRKGYSRFIDPNCEGWYELLLKHSSTYSLTNF
ncbi:hypothetical protein Bca4012_026765 [Brassica carinata]